MVAAGPKTPPRNQVVPSGTTPQWGHFGTPLSRSVRGPVHVFWWAQRVRGVGAWVLGATSPTGAPVQRLLPPPCHPSSGSYLWYDPPCVIRHPQYSSTPFPPRLPCTCHPPACPSGTCQTRPNRPHVCLYHSPPRGPRLLFARQSPRRRVRQKRRSKSIAPTNKSYYGFLHLPTTCKHTRGIAGAMRCS